MRVIVLVFAFLSFKLDCCLASIGKFFQRLGNGVSFDHQHQTTEPLRKLATTPLYYLANERGQQYLQDDVQVIQVFDSMIETYLFEEQYAQAENHCTLHVHG